MNRILAIMTAIGLSLSASAAFATDDFGGSYFTAEPPAALQDGDEVFSPEALGSIEPAAGGEPGFILPDEEAGSSDEAADIPDDPAKDRLSIPEETIVPGMEQ